MVAFSSNFVSSVSSVKARDDEIMSHVYANQIRNNILDMFGMMDIVIEPQGLFYNEEQMQDFIDVMKDKMPPSEEISNVLKSVKEFTATNRITDDIKNGIAEALKAFSDLNKRAENAIEKASDVLSGLGAGLIVFFLVEFLEKPSKKSAIILVCVTVLLCTSDTPLNPLKLYQAILQSSFVQVVLDLCAALTSKAPKGDEGIVPQSAATTAIYDTMIVGWMSYLGYNGADLDKKRLSQFSEALRLRSSLPEFLDSIKDNLIWIYNNLVADFFGLNKLPYKSFDDPYLQAFEDRVLQITEDIAHGKYAKSEVNFAEIKALHEQSKTLYKSIPPGRDHDSVRRIFIKNENHLAKIRVSFENANIHLNGYRVEPVGILIRGSPGTHKSNLLECLKSALAGAILDNETLKRYYECPQNFEYNRQQETVYMDGYSPETISVTFDDLGQMRDVAGNPDTEWMNVIRFVNSFEAIGHAAAMEQKGVMRIRPLFVMATTNLMKLQCNSIISMEAVIRRFPISIVVVPKPEFKKEGSTGIYDQSFDYTKLPQKEVDGRMISDITYDSFLFYNCDNNGTVIGDSYDFHTLVKNILDRHYDRNAWHKQHTTNFKRVTQEFHDKYHPVEDNIEPQSGFPYFTPYPESSNESEIVDISNLREINNNFGATFDVEEKYIRELLRQRKSLVFKHGLDNMEIIDATNHGPITNLTDNYNLDEELRQEYLDFYYDNGVLFPKISQWYKPFFAENVCVSHLPFYDIGFILYSFRKKQFLMSLALGRPVNEFEPLGEEIYKRCDSVITTTFTKMKDIFMDWKKNCMQFIRYIESTYFNAENYKRNMLVVTMISGVATLLMSSFFFGKEKICQPEAHFYESQKGGQKSKNLTLKQLKQLSIGAQNGIQPQSADVSGFDIMQSVSNKNMSRVYIFEDDDDETPYPMGYAILLRKNRVLIPLHFLEKISRGVSSDPSRLNHLVKLVPVGKDDAELSLDGFCTVAQLIENCYDDGLENSHMVIAAIETRDVRDIVKNFFVTEAVAANLSRQFNISMKVPHRNMFVNSTAYKAEVPMRDGNIRYNVTQGIQYHADTMVGDCGVPIFVRNARMQAHRIIGTHIAGSTRTDEEIAYSSLVTQEMILQTLKSIKDEPIELGISELKEVELQSLPIYISDRFTVLGTVKEVHSPYGISDIRKSRLQHPKGPFLSKMDVAMLRPNNGIDPYERALKNYCSNSAILDPGLARFCKEEFKSFLFSCPPGPKFILSLKEALWGDSDKLFSDAIKSSTSAGYPMKFDKNNIKKNLFALDAPRDESNESFAAMKVLCDKLIEDCSNNVRQLLIYTDNLKVERRKRAKVIEGSSRLFSGAMFVYLTVFRQYFGAFMQWIHQNSIVNSMVTAINPFSTQWDNIAYNLKRTSTARDPWVCDGDFSHYDASTLTVFAWHILDIINEWYDDGNDQIRRVLWLEIVNSRHLFNNVVYEWFGAIPSGNPFTLIFNCMNNALIHRYAFYSVIPTTVTFHKVVTIYFTGDDVLMAVIDEFKDKFNGLVVQEQMANIGYVYTSATKEDKVVPWKRLSEAQFLKRSFRFDKYLSRYVGPLDINSVTEIPLWTKKHDALSITYSNINEFFDELSLHDDSTWDMYAPDYQHAVQTLFPEFCEANGVMESRLQRFQRKMDAEILVFKPTKRKVVNPNSSP